jgi:cation diffusion facilitator CzcD-associated flavoprotein CzcO
MSSQAQRYEVIIIGSGFGGQLAALNLNRQGISDYLILERRAFMGGTWRQNVYPGAQVDVQSPLYSISFEPFDWSQMYAERDELDAYTEHVIHKHGLAQKTRTNANVSGITWLEDLQVWQVDIENQPSLQTRFIINATGPLSSPVIPAFKGRDSFEGHSFHTNQWDSDYDYRGKKVAIIGSGASAAQVIPAIADDVEHLHVFQRTPHWVMPRPDYTFKPWQRTLLRKPWFYHALRILIYWALELRVLSLKYSKTLLEMVGTRSAKKHLMNQVRDPELRKRLTPEFTIGCKRVIISNTLYPSLQKSNVTLHDRDDGIAEIQKNGILSGNGKFHEVDLIIYATGYDATDGLISYPVIGKAGKKLADVWSDYPRAYLGTTVPGFPNLFIVTGPNTGIGHTSAIFVIESQMYYIMACIEQARARKSPSIEVKPEAEERYTELIHEEMKRTVWQTGGCNSWYKSKSGKVIAMFPGFSFTFRRWARNFRPEDHQFSG